MLCMLSSRAESKANEIKKERVVRSTEWKKKHSKTSLSGFLMYFTYKTWWDYPELIECRWFNRSRKEKQQHWNYRIVFMFFFTFWNLFEVICCKFYLCKHLHLINLSPDWQSKPSKWKLLLLIVFAALQFKIIYIYKIICIRLC